MKPETLITGYSIGFILSIYAFIFILSIGMWIAMEYPFYRMAKRQGLPNAWLAFIPWGNFYITLKLSPRKFNLYNLFKYDNRSKAFTFFVIVNAVYIVLILPMSLLAMIPILGWFLFFVYIMAYLVLCYGIMWRMYYDVLMTYGMKEHAMWASIANIFFPIIMIVFSYIIMNREPDMNA